MTDESMSAPSILERLEDVMTFFSTAFLAWGRLDKASRPSKIRFLPTPFPACSVLTSIRIVYLASAAHKCILQKSLLTKRDIYYMCRVLFTTPSTVDRALGILSSGIEVERNELNIVAAPKGIVVGNVSFVDEDNNQINVGMFGVDGCLIPSRPERMTCVSVQATMIIVIEKEASFHSLLHERASTEFFRSSVLVTGKGYPDVATRHFLKKLYLATKESGIELPVYLLTDADPHGISIAMCYLESLSGCNVKWLGVRPSDNRKAFQISPSSLLPLHESERSLMKSMKKRCSNEAQNDSSEHAAFHKELCVIMRIDAKFEMEALSVTQSLSGFSGLLEYLVTRICDEKESQGRSVAGSGIPRISRAET